MTNFEILSNKLTDLENRKGELLPSYLFFWQITQNLNNQEFETILARFKKLKPETSLGQAYIELSEGIRDSFYQGYSNAYQKLTNVIEVFKQHNDIFSQGAAETFLTVYYKNIGQLDKAQELIQKAISNLSENEAYLHFSGIAYYQAGEIHHLLNDYDSAIDFFTKGLLHQGNKTGMITGRLLSGLGTVYLDKNELDKAIDTFQKALQLVSGMNNYVLESKLYADISKYYYKITDFDNALAYQEKSVAIRKERNLNNPLITNYIELAELYLKQSKTNEALHYALLAEKLSQENNVVIKLYQTFLVISTIYESIGEKGIALDYYKKYHQTKDELLGSENARKIKQISLHHEMDTMQKEKEIFKLRNIVLKQALDEISASVRYAKRIQEAILPPMDLIQSKFKDVFVLYKPKDVVAGDFYFVEEINDTIFIAAADCTGHGVPGAIVSVVCSNSLNRVVYEHKLTDPAEILAKTSLLVCATFEKSVEEVKDGMDISLLAINKKKGKVYWGGANNPLWYFENNEFHEIAPVKRPIGKSDLSTPFVTHTVDIKPNTTFYLFTDGFADQFGGPHGKKYKYTQLKNLLAQVVNENAPNQHNILNSSFENWKGDLEQVDDVCIIGVKI